MQVGGMCGQGMVLLGGWAVPLAFLLVHMHLCIMHKGSMMHPLVRIPVHAVGQALWGAVCSCTLQP